MDNLDSRLQGLPLILTGPILRRVTTKSVTVWVALKNAATVTLQISDAVAGTKVGNAATQPTVAIGRFLHLLAITVQVDLTPGVVYNYDLSFVVFDEAGHLVGPVPSLTKAIAPTTLINPISYSPFLLPTFSLPPKDPNQLRIIHGSCRMPHGNGPDALSLLDGLIETTAQDPINRPHQLLLMGDQIYADDVSAALLMQLMDASNTLLGMAPSPAAGWHGEETLPAGLPVGGPNYHTHKPSDYPPLSRTGLLGRKGAGFTSADLRNHLMSLGEYLCMYLFTWSDVLWPKTLPTKDEIVASAKAKMKASNYELSKGDINAISGDSSDVEIFRKTLFRVRRALANIPTYMICDDHDVTDDWNMTIDFCDRVYDADNKLGKQIVQNALVAYALCQLWGNTPEQFQVDASNNPAAGRKLLTALDSITSANYGGTRLLQTVLSVHDADRLKVRKPESVYHEQTTWLTVNGVQVSADSLVYNFTYEGPAHQIIFTDTRTWRSYRNGKDATPDLLPPDQIIAQIPLTPATGDRVLIVVLTTNAPPVQPIRGATRHDSLTTRLSKTFTSDAHPDLYEAWELPSLPFDLLLKRLTDKLNPDASGVRHGQFVVLSGDVHFSFASRIVYHAKNRLEDAQPQPASAVFAQLVSSSFKKQNGDTVGFQQDGYFYVPHSPMKLVINQDMTEGYVGWNVPQNSSGFDVGTFNLFDTDGDQAIRPITHDDPTIQIYPFGGPIAGAINLKRAPDFRYRLDYLLPSAQAGVKLNPPSISPPGPGATTAQRNAALQASNAATSHYRDHTKLPGKEKIIGCNNLGEITFDWAQRQQTQDPKKVNHTVRWRFKADDPNISWDRRVDLLLHAEVSPDPEFADTYVMWTTYTVSLDPDDPTYTDFKATSEGP